MLAVRILALRSGGICKWVHLIDGDQGDGVKRRNAKSKTYRDESRGDRHDDARDARPEQNDVRKMRTD